MARLSETWQSFKHPKSSSIPSKPDRAHICTISMIKLMTFMVMCKAYSGEPSIDLLRSFLNLGRAGDWLTLSKMDFRSFMVQGVDALVINVEPISVVHPSDIAKNIMDSRNTSSKEGLSLISPDAPSYLEVGKRLKVFGKRKFPSAKELKDATDCHWVVAHVTPPSWKQYLMEIRHPSQVNGLQSEYSRLILEEKKWINYEQTLSTLRAKVEGLRSKGKRRVAELKKPFVLEEMPGYRPSLNEEYDQSGNDLADASYPFLAELTVDPHASVEQLLSKKS
ncbi:hypothetical protein Tco_0774309 [Tanacetum coccineum]|uniref:Uncharacterized protein n=1 Tax=Tanacetum coccineum TaxID=301880 RepID=A0ABQ4ZSF5_9ASTR